MARYCPLFSGSSGNCTYIGGGDGGILIDAGVSAKRIQTALTERGIDPALIRAVFVTHEHRDHVCGLRVLVKRYGYPVYATAGTLAGIMEGGFLEPDVCCHPLEQAGYEAGSLFVEWFPTPHDSRQSCGYRVHTADDRVAAVATDIGRMTDTVRMALHGCDLVQLESNHDLQMLRTGAYPYFLKRRILADTGHLSNDACAAELTALAAGGTTRFILAHLSRENNLPDLAYHTAENALTAGGLRAGYDYRLSVAAPADTAGVVVF